MYHDNLDQQPLGPRSESPHHGFQGDRAVPPPRPRLPASLTIAISREAGSRGASIARRVGEQLGWRVYTQDLLEYTAQDELIRHEVFDSLSPEAVRWVEEHLAQSPACGENGCDPLTVDLVRMVLALGVQGEVILIGRGAGYILPRSSTLHVRLIAPLADRIAYMSQWLRLTEEEATHQVVLRDQRRDEFIETNFGHKPADIYQYDLLLNTSYIGEELSAALIHESARGKLAHLLDNS
jgi:cytidylate kinase